MMPRVSRYFPSQRWYGSVFVPMAMCSPRHRRGSSSTRSRSTALTFTTMRRSKSRPVSRSRYVVGGTSEAVVTHDAVRDEVTRPGGDVVHRDLDPERHNAHDVEVGVPLERHAVDGPLAGDHRVDGEEEAETFARPPTIRTVRMRLGMPRSSTTKSKANRSSHLHVSSMSQSSVLLIRSTPREQLPSASKIPARKPLPHDSDGLVGQVTMSSIAATAIRLWAEIVHTSRVRSVAA